MNKKISNIIKTVKNMKSEDMKEGQGIFIIAWDKENISDYRRGSYDSGQLLSIIQSIDESKSQLELVWKRRTLGCFNKLVPDGEKDET